MVMGSFYLTENLSCSHAHVNYAASDQPWYDAILVFIDINHSQMISHYY